MCVVVVVVFAIYVVVELLVVVLVVVVVPCVLHVLVRVLKCPRFAIYPGPFSEYGDVSPGGGGIGRATVELLVAFCCMKNKGSKVPSPLRFH